MSEIHIFVGSVFGGALDVADELKAALETEATKVVVHEQPELADLITSLPNVAIFCTSTTGSGDFPGNINAFVSDLNEQGADLTSLRYGMIAMGDSSYATFCGAGRRLDELLTEYGAQRMGDRLEIDAAESLHADEDALEWLESWLPLVKG